MPLEASNQKVMNLFGRSAIPMVLDFAEANILGDSVGAWKTCSDYVADCIKVGAGWLNTIRPSTPDRCRQSHQWASQPARQHRSTLL